MRVCVCSCVFVALKSVQFLCFFRTHRFALAIIAIAIACAYACLSVVHLLILLQFLFYSSCSTECGLLPPALSFHPFSNPSPVLHSCPHFLLYIYANLGCLN